LAFANFSRCSGVNAAEEIGCAGVAIPNPGGLGILVVWKFVGIIWKKKFFFHPSS
jgi:hypothetical protein